MLARLRIHLVAVAVAIAAAGSSAVAQEIAAPAPNDAPAVTSSVEAVADRVAEAAPEAAAAGPIMAGTSFAARADLQASANADAAAMMQSRDRRGTTLMLVGGAAFLAGLLIGDDAGTAVALGGAIVGLYGLYMYLQ